MNRIITAITMLIVAISVASFESSYVIGISDKVQYELETALNMYEKGDIENAEKNLYEAENIWNRNKKLLNSMLIHNNTEMITEEIVTIKNLLKYDMEDFPVECENAIGNIEVIKYSMIPYIDNIL